MYEYQAYFVIGFEGTMVRQVLQGGLVVYVKLCDSCVRGVYRISYVDKIREAIVVYVVDAYSLFVASIDLCYEQQVN